MGARSTRDGCEIEARRVREQRKRSACMSTCVCARRRCACLRGRVYGCERRERTCERRVCVRAGSLCCSVFAVIEGGVCKACARACVCVCVCVSEARLLLRIAKLVDECREQLALELRLACAQT
eukprot:3531547-Pleurochrysis_carterae.AAC.1